MTIVDIERAKWDYWIQGKPTDEIGKEYGVTGQSIRFLFKQRGIEMRHNRDGIMGYKVHGRITAWRVARHCNEGFFKNLDHEAKGYWLGFIFADGCIADGDPNHPVLQIHLQFSDAHHIRQFRKDIDSNAPIYHYPSTPNAVSIAVRNQQFMANLLKWGLTPRKTYTMQWPSIPSNMTRHFIRGIMDGDGCMSRAGDNVRYPVCEVMASESSDFLQSLATELRKHGIACWYKPSGHTRTPHVQVKRNIDKITYFRFLYSGATRYLDRKLKWWRVCMGNDWVQRVLDSDPAEIQQLGLDLGL